jgi:hypothetical protein
MHVRLEQQTNEDKWQILQQLVSNDGSYLVGDLLKL